MTQSSRIQFIDVLKGFLIIGVILVHTKIPMEWSRTMFLFVVSSFFLINGMLSKKHMKKKVGDFVKKNAKSILIPYFIIGVISYLYWIGVNSIFNLNPGIPIYKPVIGLVYGNGHDNWLAANTPLWFLPCLFSVQILHYIVRRIASKHLQFFIVIMLFFLGILNSYYPIFNFRLPFGIDMALYLLILGYIGAEWKSRWLKIESQNVFYGLFLLITAFVGTYYLGSLTGGSNLNINVLFSAFSPVISQNILLIALTLIAPPILFFLAFKYLTFPKIVSKPLAFIGRYSLYFFALHWLAFGVSEFLQRYVNLPINAAFLDLTVSLTVISLGIYLTNNYFLSKKVQRLS